jgi:hypothetical protein
MYLWSNAEIRTAGSQLLVVGPRSHVCVSEVDEGIGIWYDLINFITWCEVFSAFLNSCTSRFNGQFQKLKDPNLERVWWTHFYESWYYHLAIGDHHTFIHFNSTPPKPPTWQKYEFLNWEATLAPLVVIDGRIWNFCSGHFLYNMKHEGCPKSVWSFL